MPAQKHTGSCQCGAVAFDVNVDLSSTITCNCSRCRRSGTILAFAPWDHFTLIKGEDATTEFQFNKHLIHHKFCTTCGIQSYAQGVDPKGQKTAAVNVRCLDGVDLDALTPHKFNGAKI
ncbi:MAG: GFA family protein [Terricaulis silvestris]